MPTTFKTLANFSTQNGNLNNPTDVLFADSLGNILGTTKNGGANSFGAVFEISLNSGTYGPVARVVNFTSASGARPDAGLIADAAGNLFGTTHSGGAHGGIAGAAVLGGTAFEITRTAGGVYINTPTIIADFNFYGGPVGGLVADSFGNLFGMAAGVSVGPITIFEIPKTANGYSPPIPLASFTVTNASTPTAGLFIDSAGNLIGTTTGGGTSPFGGVFEIAKTVTGYATVPTPLINFSGSDGANPNSSLIADSAGNLYGTTEHGGDNALNDGTVYEILKTNGSYDLKPTTLVSFDLDDGAFPAAALIADVDGNLYGTTKGGGASGLGTVFEVTRNSKSATGFDGLPRRLVDFNGLGNGAVPSAGLIGNAAGNLFGTTSTGGSAGQGTVFEVLGSGFRSSHTVVAPTAGAVSISPARGDLMTGTFVTFTIPMSAAVTLSSNAPSLTLNDGGNASYDAAHSTPTSLVFDYTVGAGDSTTALVATGLLTHGATITDVNGSPAVFAPALPATFSGVEINIPPPSVSSVAASPNSGNQQTGTLVTLTVTMSEPVAIAGGTPSLTLNDGGTAVYNAAHSTTTALAFDYTAQATESTTALAVVGFKANSATILDTLANNADFAAASVTFTGLAINSVLPAVLSIVASPGVGNVSTGALVTFTATMSEAVLVSDGAPTLTLNDGGSAIYDVSRSTGTTLVFDYTVLAAQTTKALATTAFNANGAKIADKLGNGAVMTGAVASFSGLAVNLPAPTVLSVAASPATGDVMTGNLVTFTVTMSKAVTVTAGTPVLTLNDGANATYEAAKSGTTTLVFDYVPQPNQSTTALAITALNANGATIQDATGIGADFAAAAQKFVGLEINITTPTAPTISGTASGQATTDTAAISPFAGVTITDLNATPTEILTVTLSSPANGTLSNLGGGSYDATSGVYTLTGSPSVVTVALEGVVFTPTARQAASGQVITTTVSIRVSNGAGLSATNTATSIVTTEGQQSTTGVLGVLGISQQLELIYIAYFNRGADGGGYSFWNGQNVQAQAAGQSASLALTNIANSFQPQPETIALYPFLGGTKLNLADPVVQAGLASFISSAYRNLFGHAADPLGAAYWAGQLSAGTVGLGAAALAIANGATNSDAIAVRNKIAVAQDFTTRTVAAGLGVTSAPATLVAAARAALAGVDGASLNDPSVAAGTNVTTTYLAAATTSKTSALATSSEIVSAGGAAAVGADPLVVAITGSDRLVDPAVGRVAMQFLANAAADAPAPSGGGAAPLAGFDFGMHASDVGPLPPMVSLDLRGDFASLTNDVTGPDQGAASLLGFDPFGQGAGNASAPWSAVGHTVTNPDTMLSLAGIRIP